MKNRPITDHLAQEKTTISVEFFPPKDEEGGEMIVRTALDLKEQAHPDFVSITYGAGGSTRERTFRYANILKDDYGFEVMPHLTCVGSSRAEIIDIVKAYVDAGFCNLMALRGDPPKGAESFRPHPDGPAYASDLVALLRENFAGLCLGVAGYPEVHPEATSAEEDLRNLKRKVDAGASFITTQLFYRNEHFLHFVERCREVGILSAKAARRFCQDLPAPLNEALDAAGDDPHRVQAVGMEWTYRQIHELREAGCRAFHLYIMNRSSTILPLLSRFRADGLFGA
jgi:methylenetetrahydrofolate reductase (NADPH)